MKKLVLAIMLCVACFMCSMCVDATEQQTEPDTGFALVINGEATDATSVICNETHYLPARMVFEKIGARVFFRMRDRKILVLTRDGDVIQHVVGTSAITINGEVKRFPYPSVSECNVTCLPIDMMSAAFRTSAVSFSDGQININKPISDTDYGRAVKEVLDASGNSNFYPERFKRYINYHIKNPSFTIANVLFMVNLGLDFPFYENVSVISDPNSRLVLVNKYNRLPWAFKPSNLVTMDKKYTVSDGKKYLLDGTAYEKFAQMSDAARKEGLSIRTVSAYRTEDYQRNLYNKKTRTLGVANVDNYSAKPGFSEHETGLAVDINSTNTSFEKTNVFKWLQAHAHEYGFILRYPKGKRWITGYEYEPWHYRYVGVDAAKIIHQEDSTYEQYYAKYIDKNEFK